ncbi:MAG TPA: TonB-dependent receptor [Puia sp.]|uniref:TonB-dependent receptor n=1 Tax=Puia sp. TaxID=2045100 RepID=UPI002B62CD6C|nr:TonB-dependent receptor [Puia sp.]HVU94530.1 TonB-dependent receptor [Puia sp.]
MKRLSLILTRRVAPILALHLILLIHTTAQTQLDSVTVTAEKREAPLQKVPVSVTAIGSKQVDAFRLWDIKGITGIVPNLYSGNSGDGRNVTSIRGVTTTSYDPAVATYIDGVNQFSLDTYIPELNDIERIEILRGPQGTLYGRNAMGGVINIITKQPDNNTHGFAQIDEGSYKQQRYAAGIRTPVVENRLFFGAAAAYNKRDGYYTNDFNNSSFDRQSALTGNYYLKYLPGKQWSLTLNVKHENNRNRGAFPLSTSVDEAFTHPFHLDQNAIGKMIDNTLNAALVINHSSQALNLSSITAWQNNHRYYQPSVDGDFSPIDGVTIINDFGRSWNNVQVFTQELRFASSDRKSSPFSWTAGAYFFHQYNPNRQATHYGADAGLLGSPITDFSSIDITKGKNTGVAGYGQANYKATDKLTFIAGLRYDYEHRYLDVREQFQPDGQPAITTTPDTNAALHFSALSPKAGIAYQPSNNTNLYATYSRGYRPGGLTQLSPDPSQPPLYPYNPEYSDNVEIGIKNTFWDRRIQLNATAFLTHVTNAQVPTLILPSAITVTRNTGKLISKGVELEAAANPVNGLQLIYSFGYTDAHYKSLNIAENGQAVDLAGKKQIFTPEFTSMFAPQYTLPLSTRRHLDLVARGEWFWLGREYFDLDNNIVQQAHSLVNIRAGLTLPHLECWFWMRNLGDAKYIEYAYDFGAVHLGDPRTWGITLKTSW